MSDKKQFKLTKYTKSGGWGSKFSIEDLGKILSLFNLENKNPNILVDSSHKDDAAVYKLNENQCLVLTVDFFPPNVDDPFTYGEIVAPNSMSDIYAMGVDPVIGLNIAAFPKTCTAIIALIRFPDFLLIVIYKFFPFIFFLIVRVSLFRKSKVLFISIV